MMFSICGHAGIKGRCFYDSADPAATFQQTAAAKETDAAVAGGGKTGHHADERCLSGSVFSDKSVDVPLIYGHGQIFYNGSVAVAFCEVVCL